ncbi:MAG: RNA polymerase sigma factor [Verrucomicrobia bacterium]|nr:RNA polymerase sigma factor [Verrucomicrobiota bacterium]MCH8510589.1 RNA polymerase sigma factor [Kiritimatiellia bacterium]
MNATQQHLNQAVHEWYDPLYRFALSLCQNVDHAQDLTQNAFHKLARKHATLRDATKTKSWLFSVLYREFVDGYRRSVRYPSTSLDSVPEPSRHGGRDAQLSHDAKVMMRMLGELDDIFRAPLTLFYLEQLSYKEIAEVLNIPIGTVMSRLRRAKDRLRERMEELETSNQANNSQTPLQTIPFPREARHG